MMRLLVAPPFLMRGSASLPVGAAILRLIVSAGETIVVAAIVFFRTGDGRRGGERQTRAAPAIAIRILTSFSCCSFPADVRVAADAADIQSKALGRTEERVACL
jgi:hypothetical protein